MKKHLFPICSSIITAYLMTLTSNVWSQSHSLDAHVHGTAELLIAVESKKIEMQLLSPAANILGFEHTPANDKQWQKISTAEKLLGQPDMLFVFQGDVCRPESTIVEMPFDNEAHTEDTEHAHTEHSHEHEHEHDGHNAKDSHTEVSALYQFQCAGGTLKEIQIELLNHFPAIESLKVQWINDNNQGSKTLNHNSSLIRID